MKIRTIAIIYTILILFGIISCYRMSQSETFREHDMVVYHEQLTLIAQEAGQGTTVKTLEDAYQCRILMNTDEHYESSLNERIKAGDVILDLHTNGQYVGKVAWNTGQAAFQELKIRLLQSYILFCIILLAAGYAGLGMVHYSMVRPFRRLQTFTGEIAKGNLDLALPIERNNFFGAFTESFDIMREELKKAKANEYEANRSKKELVAELSHDIKTPLATIRAACEVMQVQAENADGTEYAESEENIGNVKNAGNMQEKVNVIAGKAEMIDRLISNLFQATMEELEVLKVEATEESSQIIKSMFGELKFYGEIRFENEVPECLLYIDKLRLQQVIDNIINNSYKYAGTAIVVSFHETEDGILIRIKDSGPGVPEEELVLVTEKYYRGGNAKGKAGSGLGLYLANVFLSQMRGGLECYNEDGFVTVLYIKKVSNTGVTSFNFS